MSGRWVEGILTCSAIKYSCAGRLVYVPTYDGNLKSFVLYEKLYYANRRSAR
ncbi:MAG: hypothetical protein J4473_02150 [Candidatus Aenigmarchaeota archaeon]|nr:hypothetical protein [Candidatus Aenigmarchaeota archaeon]